MRNQKEMQGHIERISSCIKRTNNENPTSHFGWLQQLELQHLMDQVIDAEDAIQVYFLARNHAKAKVHNYDYFGDNNLK